MTAKPERHPEKVEASKYAEASLAKRTFSRSPKSENTQCEALEKEFSEAKPAAVPTAAPAAVTTATAENISKAVPDNISATNTSATGKAKSLWGAATKAGYRGASTLQMPSQGERVRGAVLLPAAPQGKQQHQKQRSSPCNAEGTWGYCLPPGGGVLLGSCCEKPPKSGVVLPPLRQRQQSSRGPCTRQRVPSGGHTVPMGHFGGVHPSASAASLLPALKPAASAAASAACRGGLVGSASAVDLSVVGRPLGPSRVASTYPVSMYAGPRYDHYTAAVGGLQGGPLLGPLPLPRRLQKQGVVPTAGVRKHWAAPSRSNSNSSGKVFSRTRRSCSPIKENSVRGTLEEEAPANGSPVAGNPSYFPGAHLCIESKVSPSAADARVRGPHGARLRGPARQGCGTTGTWGSVEVGGFQGVSDPALRGASLYAVTPPRELSPIGMQTMDWGRGITPSYGEGKGALSMATAANSGAVRLEAAAAVAARLISPSSGTFVSSYSQPPRGKNSMEAMTHLNRALLNQKQQQAFLTALTSPAAATASASRCDTGTVRSPLNACSPVDCRCATPLCGRSLPLSTVPMGLGVPLGDPRPAAGKVGGPWGACSLLSPLCYSNPPAKSPNSGRSSSNIQNIQRQKDDVGEWPQKRL